MNRAPLVLLAACALVLLGAAGAAQSAAKSPPDSAAADAAVMRTETSAGNRPDIGLEELDLPAALATVVVGATAEVAVGARTGDPQGPQAPVASMSPPAPPSVLPVTATAPPPPPLPGLLFGLVNQERAAVGLPALIADAGLVGLAEAQSSRIEAAGMLLHQDLSVLLSQGWSKGGENVAYGPSLDWVHDRLVTSASHHANMVNPAFTHLGIAVVRAADGLLWVAEVFAG